MRVPRTNTLAVPLPYPVQQFLEFTAKLLSGRVSFGSSIESQVVGTTAANQQRDRNIDCYKVSGTTPSTANTEFAVPHWLTRVPVGFLIASTQPAGHIYKSTTAWTAASINTAGNIYLKSDTASVAYVLVVI